ncbi:MAG: CBS domain-containing protein [Mariprofundus sp.]|nr:CBS domain-containing protein [Mariprofundus sp.]
MFTVYGPGITNPVSLEQLFVRHAVAKPAAVAAKQAIKTTIESQPGHAPAARDYHSSAATQQYQKAEAIREKSRSLKAGQIMTAPVVYVLSTATVAVALDALADGKFRHIPVLSSEQQIVGMISDRDIVSCLCGSAGVCVHCAKDKQEISLESIMKTDVLSASIDTDARYIARVFVEQHIGAMPVTEKDQLVGMITRSDILRAVMVNFDLNLWS